jgi:hypothetical protein
MFVSINTIRNEFVFIFNNICINKTTDYCESTSWIKKSVVIGLNIDSVLFGM